MGSIKDKIVFIEYEGHIEEKKTKFILQGILSYKDTISSRGLKGFFVSLKKAKLNESGLKYFINELEKLTKNIDTSIGIGDFTADNYHRLIKYTKETHIKIFRNENIAKLLLHPDFFKKKLKVIIFDDGDTDNEDNMASILSKFEHTVLYVKSKEEYISLTKSGDIDFAISQTKLNIIKKEKVKDAVSLKLGRNVIIKLPYFINTAVDNLMTVTSLKAIKISHKIQIFNSSLNGDFISALMKFKGDLCGSFLLIFPKNLAIRSIEAMLGEKLEKPTLDEISDGVGEFCNIITGSTKTRFLKENIKVLFELPKTYTSLKSAQASIGKNLGVWINMQLEDEPFYMYITD